MRMIFKTFTARYIIESLTHFIRYCVIYNISFPLIKLWNNIYCVILSEFSTHMLKMCYCIHVVSYICHVLVVPIRNMLEKFRYININAYNITLAYQSSILTYSTRASLLRKCACGNIWAYLSHVCHMVRLSY